MPLLFIFNFLNSLCIKHIEFTLMCPIVIQVHRIHFCLHLFLTFNSFFPKWQTWFPLHIILINLIISSAYNQSLISTTTPSLKLVTFSGGLCPFMLCLPHESSLLTLLELQNPILGSVFCTKAVLFPLSLWYSAGLCVYLVQSAQALKTCIMSLLHRISFLVHLLGL